MNIIHTILNGVLLNQLFYTEINYIFRFLLFQLNKYTIIPIILSDTGQTAPPMHYMWRDHAIAHELTNHCIHRQHPACGRQVRLETGWADGAESCLCPQLAQEEVFPGYAQQG